MDERPDELIAADVQNGDTDKFAILVSRYENKLTRYAHKFLQDQDEVRDLVQEVFIKAYTNLMSFDASKRFSPWIYRIAHNEFVNVLRKKSRMPSVSLDPDIIFPHPVAAETADGQALTGEMKRTLDGYLNKINPKYREPLVLFYFEDMDYRQIADVLKVPVSTVGVWLQRGRAALKDLMISNA